MASDALADALAYLLSRHLRGVDRRLDVDRVFAPGFGRRLWASSIARGRSQDPLLGLIPADSSNRQEGSKREEQILVEAVPREIRPEPVDGPDVAKFFAEVRSVLIRAGDAADRDCPRRFQRQHHDLIRLHPLPERPQLRDVV
jgi:hypothetical protein